MSFEVGDRVISKTSGRQGVVKQVDHRDERVRVKFDDPKLRFSWFFFDHFEKARDYEKERYGDSEPGKFWAPGDSGLKCHGDDHVAPRIDGGCDMCGMKGGTKADHQLQYRDTVEYEGEKYMVTCADSVTGLLTLSRLDPNGEFEGHTGIHPDQVRYVDPALKKIDYANECHNDNHDPGRTCGAGRGLRVGDTVRWKGGAYRRERLIVDAVHEKAVDIHNVETGKRYFVYLDNIERVEPDECANDNHDPGCTCGSPYSPWPNKVTGGNKEWKAMAEEWKAANPGLNESWIEEAQRIVGGSRQEDYGDAEDMTAKIAAVWSQYLGVEVTPRQFCMLMVLLKVMRDSHKAKRDNPVDIHGYLLLLEKNERRAEGKR